MQLKQVTKAAPPRSTMPSSIDDTPTEPATSPRMLSSQVREWPMELQLPTGEIGPREEPERYPTRFILSEGQWTPEELHEVELRKAAQGVNQWHWSREAREAALREKEEQDRSVEEWKAQVEGRGFPGHPAIPFGPHPKETSSMRVLPNVHEALRQNDPSMAPGSQPVLKKAPPSAGRPRPKGFYSDSEPPRIGTTPAQPPPPSKPVNPRDVQPQGVFHPLTATPMTPRNPPRPPIEELPKPMPMPIETSQATHKHPLPQPAQQGPPNKQARHKAFPHDQQPPATVSMASPSAVDMPRQGTPSPKGPPASFMPTPGDVQHVSSSLPAADQEDISGRRRYRRVRLASDISWDHPLEEQLEPNLTGGPDPSKSFDDLCLLRKQIPRLDNRHFNQIYPSDNVIRVVQKTHGVHEVKMREVAAWVLNATHWFSLLKQPMMIVIWCRDWSDASKFQYLMQILQGQFQDCVLKYHIFVDQEDNVDKLIQYWQEPTTLWHGQPVLGFMAETYLDDLQTVGFKVFNPMWSFPTTSVNQNWEPMTFGVAPWHLFLDAEESESKEALQSQSPIAAFKACNVTQTIGIAYSKIVFPSFDSKGESKSRTYCPTTWNNSYTWQYAAEYADQLRRVSRASALLCEECTLLVRIQLSSKIANHPNCAFADSASTVMCGAMISLTPCIAPTVERECDLHEYAEFKDAEDMIQKLNEICPSRLWLSIDPSSKERLPYYDTPAQEETFAVCHVSRAGLRKPCLHV